MSLRPKLILGFLLVSLLTAAAVGAMAWWMVMQNFRDVARERAFADFSDDVRAYVQTYGSWSEAERAEPFGRFVRQRRGGSGGPLAPMPPEAMEPGAGLPPPPGASGPRFHFLLLAADGHVVLPAGGYARGQPVPEAVRRQGQPITADGRVVLYAVPVGTPIFTREDRRYMGYMQRALVDGLMVAAALAVLLGVVLGSRLANSLRALVAALEGMRPDGEFPQPLPVRSRDETGQLAQAFNRMSRQLIQAHRELRDSHQTISRQAEQLREQSLRDALTGLHNRRCFDQRAPQMLDQAQRRGHPLCVMLADLDHFKSINDRYSHAVGDAVLQRVAAIFAEGARGSDLLARYGGEELVAVFADCDLAQAQRRCEALRQRVSEESWDDIAQGLRVTVSIGLCDTRSADSVPALLSASDAQLYRAKHGGRNRVEPLMRPRDRVAVRGCA